MTEANSNATTFLLENACPSIRYQTLKLLVNNTGSQELEEAREALETCSDTERLLALASGTMGNIGFQNVHGGKKHHLENVLPMLLDRGLDASFSAFDAAVRPNLGAIDKPQFPDAHCFHLFMKIVIVPFLLAAGYREEWMLDFWQARLKVVGAFARRMDFDLYGDQSQYKGIPKPFRDRKVIKPELYVNGVYQFPLIYDLYACKAMYAQSSAAERSDMDAILAYVLSGEYQRLPRHYGLLRESASHYYAMGWDALLPRCEAGMLTAAALHRMELLAGFPMATRSPWFREHLALLNSYRQEEGTFALPAATLNEKESYWVLAGHMALGEDRKRKIATRIEGTFRAMRLMAAMGHTPLR